MNLKTKLVLALQQIQEDIRQVYFYNFHFVAVLQILALTDYK